MTRACNQVRTPSPCTHLPDSVDSPDSVDCAKERIGKRFWRKYIALLPRKSAMSKKKLHTYCILEGHLQFYLDKVIGQFQNLQIPLCFLTFEMPQIAGSREWWQVNLRFCIPYSTLGRSFSHFAIPYMVFERSFSLFCFQEKQHTYATFFSTLHSRSTPSDSASTTKPLFHRIRRAMDTRRTASQVVAQRRSGLGGDLPTAPESWWR